MAKKHLTRPDGPFNVPVIRCGRSGAGNSGTGVIARQMAGRRAWPQEKHAKLLRKTPVRREKAALAEPRPAETHA